MATMAVTQETPPLSATAARRAATAATVAANKAKAAPGGATNKPAAPVPGAATAKSKTQTATTIRLPPSTAAAPPKPATKSVTPTTPKPTTPKPTTTAPTTAKDAPSVAAAKTAARPSPAKKPTAPTAATSSSDTPTAAAAGAPKAHTAAASAASRRTPATASARTTTSIRLPPNPSGAAAKPPAVAGRPPVNMTQTTIRTPVKTPATAGVKKPLNSPANASLKSGSTVARAGSATPTSAAARNKTPTASSAPVTKKAPATTPSTPLELKKAIASVKAKFDETSMQLLAKEEELASLSFLDTASSDGGETLVPEIDLSKIASQDKDVVVAVITSKEKEVAKKKHQVRTLKARLERLRLEHERRVKDLNHKVAQRQSEKEAELESLHRDLADAIEKLDEVFVLRKKLDGSRSLHSSNIEELNRIHDDNLQSLELELQVAKQDRVERTGGTGHDAQDKYRQDLEELKRSHEKKLTKLLREHKEELEMIKKQHGEEQKQEIEEHEAELRERFESELIQIKASHASLVNDHAGAGSGMAEVLQERHARALEDLKVKSEKGHQHYLGGVQNKHQSDLLRLEGKHSARVSDLESKIKRLQEKLDTDKMTIRSKAEVRSEDMKNMLASEIAKRAEKHSEKMNTLEISSKVCIGFRPFEIL
ncbi:hypothetical protein EDD21DRAFT_83872 [Dissophora ornata]|nr:hypothetical protein EDD21DRAFT_83872 [Dissophora ornata]